MRLFQNKQNNITYISYCYTTNSRYAGDTIDTQEILFLLHSLSSGSPFMLLYIAPMQYHRTCHTFSKKSSSAGYDR